MKIELCQKKVFCQKKSIFSENNSINYNQSFANFNKICENSSKYIKSKINFTLQKGTKKKKTKRPPTVLGDAETYFRRILRNYQDFCICRASNSPDKSAASPRKRSKYTNDKKITESSMPRNTRHTKSEKNPSSSYEMRLFELEETDSSTAREDDEINEINDIIIRTTKELEQVTGENQELLRILDKPIRAVTNSSTDGEDAEEDVIKQLEETENEAKKTANNIYELKTRVGELLKKEGLTEDETKELDNKNKQLKDQMVCFEANTKKIHNLIQKTNTINKNQISSTSEDENITTRNNNVDVKQKRSYNYSDHINMNKKLDVPTFAKKLSQSYSMQEKLAAENADLESVKYKLQEELLNKDQTLEVVQRELSNLQSEMRLVSRENLMLNEKLKKIQKKESKHNIIKTKKSSSTDDVEINAKLQEYSGNTYQLELQLGEMENDIKTLHDEISAVQKEREHLEQHRKEICCCLSKPTCCITPCPSRYLFNSPSSRSKNTSMTPFTASNSSGRGNSGQILRELSCQYDKLEMNLKSKLDQVTSLKTSLKKIDELTRDAENFKRTVDDKMRECEKAMKELKSKNKMSVEQEKQLIETKRRLWAAQDSLSNELCFMKNQKMFLENIHGKYLNAQRQLEEEKQQIHTKITGEVATSTLGAQLITNLQGKLDDIMF